MYDRRDGVRAQPADIGQMLIAKLSTITNGSGGRGKRGVPTNNEILDKNAEMEKMGKKAAAPNNSEQASPRSSTILLGGLLKKRPSSNTN